MPNEQISVHDCMHSECLCVNAPNEGRRTPPTALTDKKVRFRHQQQDNRGERRVDDVLFTG